MEKPRIVVITGAGGSLGPTVVRAFAGTGAVIALAGRDRARLEAVLDAAQVPADRRMASAVDLGDEAAAAEWASDVLRARGGVDTVIHLVGGYKGGTSIAQVRLADWQSLQLSLVTTTLNVARALAAPLKACGRGRFLAVTSPKARMPTARSAVYAMAKAASDALVMALADELKGTGSTANLIEVDSIDAPDARAPGAAAPARATGAEQIAAAMLALCAPESAGINGARVPVVGQGA
jgi:NADP-dependent 3-hydroxy acid dehydrogenase YdfG